MRAFVAAAILAGLAGPVMAGGRCSEPYAPVIKTGGAVSEQSLRLLREDVVSFMAASDVYQRCLVSNGADQLIAANQAQKAQVARALNEQIRLFQAGRK